MDKDAADRETHERDARRARQPGVPNMRIRSIGPSTVASQNLALSPLMFSAAQIRRPSMPGLTLRTVSYVARPRRAFGYWIGRRS